MDYKIVAAHADTGQIDVEYYDLHSNVVSVLTINVPIVDGQYVTGTALETEIQNKAPTWLLEPAVPVQAAGFDAIASQVQPPATLAPITAMNFNRGFFTLGEVPV